MAGSECWREPYQGDFGFSLVVELTRRGVGYAGPQKTFETDSENLAVLYSHSDYGLFHV
jgi:hypothetical protein